MALVLVGNREDRKPSPNTTGPVNTTPENGGHSRRIATGYTRLRAGASRPATVEIHRYPVGSTEFVSVGCKAPAAVDTVSLRWLIVIAIATSA